MVPVPTKMGGVMTNQKQGEVPFEGKQKVAQEVEVDTTASSNGENPEDPISEEFDVPKTGDAPADWWTGRRTLVISNRELAAPKGLYYYTDGNVYGIVTSGSKARQRVCLRHRVSHSMVRQV